MEYELKFAPNISTLFLEHEDINQRLVEAKNFGFKSVEVQSDLYEHPDIDSFVKLKNELGLRVNLINGPITPYPAMLGDKSGLASLPRHEVNFKQSMDRAVALANRLDCKKIHVLASLVGICSSIRDRSLMRSTYVNNLRYCTYVFREYGIVGVIEPLCRQLKPNYFLNDYTLAADIIREINSPWIRLTLDFFQLAMIHIWGDDKDIINRYYDLAGHIQIAQAPHRNKPNARGRMDYRKIFKYLAEKQYSDTIGLEYFTQNESTVDSLSFLKPSEKFVVKMWDDEDD